MSTEEFYTEEYYEAESKARDVLASEGIEFGGELSDALEDRLYRLTLSFLRS